MTDGVERPLPELAAGRRSTRLARVERCTRADAWLAGLFDAAAPRGACLVAVGGYGRGELAEHSDLDVLLLHASDAAEADLTRAAEAIWYPIWDAGVALDHSVRTVPAARSLAATDLKVLLGLLDLRVIAGDAALADALSSAVLADWRAMAPTRLAELHDMVRSRRSASGDASYLLEPDVKESYGGLRDAVVLRGLAASWVVDVEHGAPDVAVDTLLDVRDALHQVTGRRTDRLHHQEQGAVAEALGLSGSDEVLRTVASAARVIAHACDVAWHRFERTRVSATPARRLARRALRRLGPERVPLADGVVAQSGDVVLALTARPEADPVLALRAGAAAAQAGLLIAPHALARLADEAPPMPTPWPAPSREALVSLLGAGDSAIPVWESLDQAGIVDALIPQWANVRYRPQHNPVHQFTVDRHLVGTAVEAGALARQVRRPDLLILAALLHDIGKGQPGDHSVAGAPIAGSIVERMGLDPGDADDVVLLVRHHLLLSETATRRDFDDPATIAAITVVFDTRDRVDLIEALSIADARATGPAACTPWRLALMRDLAARCRERLAGASAPETDAAPERGWAIAAELALGASEGINVQWRATEHGYRMAVLAPDRVGLLATVAAVLAVHRLQVRQAQVSTQDAHARQVWDVSPMFGDPPDSAVLSDDVRRAVLGTYDPAAVLARRAASAPARSGRVPDPVVTLTSPRPGSWVLEVRAHDEPALLHRLALAVASAGASIVGAKVDTLGSEVVDVFFLTSASGLPLDEAEREGVRRCVDAALLRLP